VADPVHSLARAFLLRGIPDDTRVILERTTSHAGVSPIYPGTTAFRHHLPDEMRAWPQVILPLPKDQPLQLPRLPVVNTMAEADRYRVVLGLATQLVEKLGTPCFNHPEAVLRTTRDGVSRLLQGIPGIIMPKTIRLAPKHPKDFPAAVEKHGLTYPVILRLVGTQTGLTQTLIESADNWDKVFAIPWGGAEVYLTQYVDCQDPDGRYRRQRICILGGRVLPRSQLIGRRWSVHGGGHDDPENTEVKWLEGFEAGLPPKIKVGIQEIARRISLDYVGIDSNLRPDGTLLIFEVNASMNMTRMTRPSMAPFVQVIRDELAALLREPSRWWHSRSGVAAPSEG
jgi:glutathione synthase/RimK-type ligase-like ATP-grasp enzyme